MALVFPVTAALAGLALLILAGSAQASADEEELPMTPAAPDTLGGHLLLGVTGSAAWPLGQFSSVRSVPRRVGFGPALALDLGYGVSRQVVVGLGGEFAWFGDGTRCGVCSAQGTAANIFVRFHLVQGLRFDPWVSLGVGYRLTTLETEDSTDDYAGFEWLRLGFGGNWSLHKNLNLGPNLSLNLGGYESRPSTDGDYATHLQLMAGLRLGFDFPGR